MAEIDAYVQESHKRRKRRRAYFVFISVFLAVYFLLLAACWLVLKSPFFRVSSVVVSGNKAVASSSIRDLLFSRVLRGKSLNALLGFGNILIWPKELDSADLVFLPQIKTLSIEKNLGDRKVTVTVEEREPYGIWCLMARTDADSTQTGADSNSQLNVASSSEVDLGLSPRPSAYSQRESASDSCWWFDDEGFIFKRAPAAEGSLLVVVDDYSQDKLGLNFKVLPPEFIPNLFSIFRVLGAGDLNVKGVELNNLALQELEASTYDGPKLYFSLRFPADYTLQVIESFYSKPGFGKLQYLDFRVENRVYYK
jgi:hypothetical protein